MSKIESTVAHGPEHGLERLIFFSDAVFAIAITLLVIDLHVPHLPPGSPDRDYWISLAQLMPQFIGFAISFFVIGSFWAGHHRMMALAAHHAPSLTLPNLIFLFSIAAMPFFTAFSSANPLMRVPAFCYCAWLLLCGILSRRLQRLVTRPPIVDEHVDPALIRAGDLRGNAVILGAATAMLTSVIFPPIAQAMLMTIPLWRLVLRRRDAWRDRAVARRTAAV